MSEETETVIRHRRPKLIGLDTETVKDANNVHRLYSFQAYSEDYPNMSIFSTINDDYLTAFKGLLTQRTNKAWFVTFNLSFDGMVVSRIVKELNEFLPQDMQYTFDACFAGSRMIRCTIYKCNPNLERKQRLKWVLMDLRNLFPNTNLANIGEVLQFNKLDKPAYLGQREPTKDEFPYFYKYAMRDAEICYKMANLIRNEFKTFRTTCAGLAIRVYKRDFCHIRKFPSYNDVLNAKLRLAYHGGRTECYIRGVNEEPLDVYDVNSLYPYVMKTQLYPNVLENFVHKSNINLDCEGIAHVQITQDANFPLIGVKRMCEDGLEKLMFPNGTFDTWVTYPELRELEASNSGKILKVYEAYEWKNTCNPFSEYVDFMYAKKQAASNPDKPERMLYKIMLNGTYGKFGEHGTMTFRTYDGDLCILETNPLPKRAWYHSVPFAAYITAYARLQLWHIIRSLNPEKMYYTDTDCAHTSEDLRGLCGDNLGQLKLEKHAEAKQACYIRSKFYMINDTVTMKGFCVKDSSAQIKLAIFQNNFTRYEHRITKALEAARIHKPALYEYTLAKKFSVEEDGKRKFKRYLDNKQILFEQSSSVPCVVC